MTEKLAIALAQVDPTVGDLAGNVELILETRTAAQASGADLVVFPELCLTGYPPEDLVLKPAVQAEVARAVETLKAQTADGGAGLLIGAPWIDGKHLHNAALLLDDGEITGIRYKHDLPNYGVFDEKRVFVSGPMPGPIRYRGALLGVMICEDMWRPEVAECLQETGAEILLVLNGSPFEVGKLGERFALAAARVSETGLPLAYVNQLGGQDELVFDGGSFVVDPDGSMPVRLPEWEAGLAVTEWQRGATGWSCRPGQQAGVYGATEGIYNALVLGLRDYVEKNRFPGVILGLSGGIDSALTAAIAVDALGAERVHCVMLPYRHTSQASLDDAAACARQLGIKLDTIPIEPAVTGFADMLAYLFRGMPVDTTEENIQARSRAICLMAISNKLGYMLLTTGNKSEMSVGYATLYGDMCGGYSVLKDVYKTTCFELARWRNESLPVAARGPKGVVIPENIITKPPSAELKADQRDDDDLPPYEVLDDILDCLVEQEMGAADIVARGHDPALVGRIEGLLYAAEYKRRQAPPGVKISRRAFGRERRYPITNRFRAAGPWTLKG